MRTKLGIRGGSKLCPLVVLCVLILSLTLAIDCLVFASDMETPPPLYLTIVVHNEEDMSRGTVPKANIPNYKGNEAMGYEIDAHAHESSVLYHEVRVK